MKNIHYNVKLAGVITLVISIFAASAFYTKIPGTYSNFTTPSVNFSGVFKTGSWENCEINVNVTYQIVNRPKDQKMQDGSNEVEGQSCESNGNNTDDGCEKPQENRISFVRATVSFPKGYSADDTNLDDIQIQVNGSVFAALYTDIRNKKVVSYFEWKAISAVITESEKGPVEAIITGSNVLNTYSFRGVGLLKTGPKQNAAAAILPTLASDAFLIPDQSSAPELPAPAVETQVQETAESVPQESE